MGYIVAGLIGAGIGIADVLLLLLAQKTEAFIIFDGEKVHLQKEMWITIVGMSLICVYLKWLIGDQRYILGVQWLLAAYLLPLSIADHKYRYLPDTLHIAYGIIFFAYKLTCGSWHELINGGLAAGGVFLFFGAVCLVKKDQFGVGDLKTLCVCAFLAGIPGIIYSVFRGLLIAAVYSVIQMIRHKAELKTEYPFVPFLLIGVLI